MELFYRKYGEGQPLIILHGIFGSCDNWGTVGKKLAENFQVYLVDQRNHGHSPHSREHSYYHMAQDLYELIEKENITNPILAGHSMGGKTAMRFALDYPEWLDKLIVVDISPRYYPVHHWQILKGLKSIPVTGIRSRSEADQYLSEFVPEWGIRQFLLKNLERDGEGFKWRLNIDGIEENIDKIGEEIQANTSFPGRTLFLKGEQSDYIFPDKDQEAKAVDEDLIAKYFPQAEFRTVSGSGHWIHAEQPEKFIESVRAFGLDS